MLKLLICFICIEIEKWFFMLNDAIWLHMARVGDSDSTSGDQFSIN